MTVAEINALPPLPRLILHVQTCSVCKRGEEGMTCLLADHFAQSVEFHGSFTARDVAYAVLRVKGTKIP